MVNAIEESDFTVNYINNMNYMYTYPIHDYIPRHNWTDDAWDDRCTVRHTHDDAGVLKERTKYVLYIQEPISLK
jgi:hypothetical protein